MNESPLRSRFCHLWHLLFDALRCDLRIFVQPSLNALVPWLLLDTVVLGRKLQPALLVRDLEVLSERRKLTPWIVMLGPIN
jgi:hypothetical protein